MGTILVESGWLDSRTRGVASRGMDCRHRSGAVPQGQEARSRYGDWRGRAIAMSFWNWREQGGASARLRAGYGAVTPSRQARLLRRNPQF